MSHRAQQIVDSIVATLAANTSIGWNVYRARIDGLAAGELELPAVVVSFGQDSPMSELGAINLAFIDSLLSLDVALIAESSGEADLTDALLEMRRQSHISLTADRSQGLSFVIDTRYAGAEAPEFHNEADRNAGEIVTHWFVHYRMNISDPS